MPRIDDPKLLKKTRRKPAPPASRSDAAQRPGAKTPKSPLVEPAKKVIDVIERLNNAAARDRIQREVNTAGPPKPVAREPEKHDADLTLGKSPRKYRKRQEKLTKQALKALFKSRSERRQSEGRRELEKRGYLPTPVKVTMPKTRKVEIRREGMGQRVPYIDGKKAYFKDGRVVADKPTSAFNRITGAALKDIGQKLSGNDRTQQRAGIDFDIGAPTKRIIAKSAIAGGKSALGALGSALDRPSAAAESLIGKDLVALGIIKDDKPGSLGKKIKAARGPAEVFVKGRRHGKDVSGGDIAEGVGLPRQAGIGVTLVTDPLMYTGVGALPKLAAQRAAALATRIEKHGPEAAAALRSEKVSSAAARARSTGDSDVLLDVLREIALERGVKRGALGITKAERQARRKATQQQKAERIDESRQILEDVRAGRASQIGEVGGKGRRKPTGTYVPDVAGMKAVESVAKLAKQKEIRPGLRLRLLAPTGRELKSIPIPVPDKLTNLRLPMGISRQGKKSLAIQRVQDARFEDAKVHAAALAEIAQQRKTQQAVGNQGALKALDDMERNLKESMAKRTTAKRDRVLATSDKAMSQSMNEMAERYNRRRMLRTVAPAANEFGRMSQQHFHGKIMKVIEDSLGPHTAKGRASQIEKIQLHRWARSDTGSQSVLKKAGVKLTPAERKVMKELDTIDAQMAKYGQAVGTLNRTLEDYGGFRMWEDAENVENTIKNMSARMGGGGSFNKHRGHAAVSDLADPEMLAAAIRRHSAKDLTDEQARALADEWHNTGAVRLSQELMSRSGQRGLDTLNLDDLPGTYVRGAKLGERRDVPMFETNAPMAPGVVRLARGEQSQREYGLPSLEPGELGVDEALKSAMADRERLRSVLRTTKSGTKVWRDHRKYIKRLDNEINALQREVGQGQLDDRLDDVDNAFMQGDDLETGDAAARAQEFLDAPDQDARLEAEISRILDDPRSGNPFDDVAGDVTSRLPDFRQSDMFPVTDMRKSYFYRTRSEAVNAAFRARWRGIDAAEGRNVDEAQTLYKAADGTEGKVSDLERWEMPRADRRQSSEWPDDREFERRMATADESKHIWEQMLDFHETEPPVMWYDRALDRIYNVDELTQTPPSLVPNRDRSVFWDLHTGREYVFPAHASADVGESIARTINPVSSEGVQYQGRVWPTDVVHAADIEAKRGGDYEIVFKTGMESALGKVLSMTRYSVTSLFPAYHTRNMISDLIKSMQADSGVMFHPIANAKLAAMAFGMGKGTRINIKGLGDMDSQDFLLMADAFGLRSGHHVAEVSRLADTGKFPERARLNKANALGPSGAIGKTAVDLGIAREDVTRFMTFAQRMRANGGDSADAMLHMIRHHFDYNDLTVNERRVVRNLFLFYTWYRKNIPLQLVEIAHRPGFFAGVAHTYNALEQGETPVNLDYSKLNPMFPDLSGKMPKRGTMPDYLKDRLSAVGVNWNGHAATFGFGAPWSDLSLLKASPEGVRDWAAMMNPVFTTGFQLGAQEDLLTGRDFLRSETGGPATAIDAAISALGVGELPKDDKGKPILPWAAAVALRNVIPGIGRSFGVFEGSPVTRDPGRAQTLGKQFNALHGINVYMSPEPGGKREELAISNRVRGRALERRTFLERIYNRTEADKERLTKAFDLETLRWMKEHNIPKEYLYTTQQSGFYQRKPRPPAASGLGEGGGIGGGLDSGGDLDG